jgi:hypothetical protein
VEASETEHAFDRAAVTARIRIWHTGNIESDGFEFANAWSGRELEW